MREICPTIAQPAFILPESLICPFMEDRPQNVVGLIRLRTCTQPSNLSMPAPKWS